MTAACQRCTRPVGDAVICSTCGGDLEKALGLVAFLEPELDLTLSRQRRFGAGSEGRSTERPMPLNVLASDLAGNLRAVLVGWCRLYAEETQADLPANTLTDMAAFLLPRVEWLRHFEAAYDAVVEITDAVRACRNVIDAPANRTTFLVGPCPEVDTLGTPCAGLIRAFIPAADGEPAYMSCRTCGAMYATWQWLRAGRRILDRQTELGLTA